MTRRLPKKKRKEEETEFQKRVVGRIRLARLLFCHVPNEGMLPVQYRVKLRAMGLESGVPDVLIFTPPPIGGFCGLAIEFKSEKGRVRPEQKTWLDDLRAAQWATLVARNDETVTRAMRALGYAYGIPGVDF